MADIYQSGRRTADYTGDYTRTQGAPVADKVAQVADLARVAIDDARTRVTDAATTMANDAMEKGRAAGQQIEVVAGNMKGGLDKSLHDQPMTTLAFAAVVGFALGAIWKS